MQHYLQSREKTILPLFVAPPVFAFYWLLLGIFLMSGFVAWFGQVPLYASGPGLISTQSPSTENQHSAQVSALIFLPVSSSSHPQSGWPALVQVSPTASPLNGTVDMIRPGVLSPSEVQKQYSFKVSTAVIVVSVKLAVQNMSLDTGSPVSGQIQVGSQHLLALFPILNALLKDK